MFNKIASIIAWIFGACAIIGGLSLGLYANFGADPLWFIMGSIVIGSMFVAMACLLPTGKYFVKFWGAALMLSIALYLSFSNERHAMAATLAYIAAFSALLGNAAHQNDSNRKYLMQHKFTKAMPYAAALIAISVFVLLTFRF
jgi:hypothetical protein